MSAQTFSQVGEGDLVEVIATILLACWRFRKWTESRWLTVGTCNRVLVVAVLQGLDGFMQYLAKDSVLSTHTTFKLCAVEKTQCDLELIPKSN